MFLAIEHKVQCPAYWRCMSHYFATLVWSRHANNTNISLESFSIPHNISSPWGSQHDTHNVAMHLTVDSRAGKQCKMDICTIYLHETTAPRCSNLQFSDRPAAPYSDVWRHASSKGYPAHRVRTYSIWVHGECSQHVQMALWDGHRQSTVF